MISFGGIVAIDLGTSRTRVFVPKKGIVFDEPTVVAVDKKEQRVIAIGDQAEHMLGRTPEHLRASRPIRNGVIAEYAVTEAFLRLLLYRVLGRFSFLKPDVFISVPFESTPVQRHALIDAVMNAGAKKAVLVDQTLAAVVGAGVPIAEASGTMVMVCGSGVSETSIISLGGVIVGRTISTAGTAFDQAISVEIKKKWNVEVGEQYAERMKIEVGSAVEVQPVLKTEIKMMDAATVTPKNILITSNDIAQVLQAPFKKNVSMLKDVLEKIPPELASDIIDKGMILCGGSAQLRYIDRFFSSALTIPVSIAEDPAHCVVKGLGIVGSNIDSFMHAISLGE